MRRHDNTGVRPTMSSRGMVEAGLHMSPQDRGFLGDLRTNLGDDADTTAAVVGQVAGAFYGEAGIPARWLARLAMREEIGALAMGLMRTCG